ncbi:hypothetical protein LSH36_501g07014 [Paralvinella palmiformis]|uniref:DDE-1 domain-containing protein n=1 Tax=Paralvinella palmiformis TaxID=53620 RepID=A0AAD9J9E1_9ANNE|nr:hypothetical protein LSH36_501g07014 [Paralvinella palmiformis]
MNRAVVGNYIRDVAKYTEGLQPVSIWNVDESGFHFEHQPCKVFCKRGERAINSRVSTSSHEVYEMLELARKEDIHLITFPRHTTLWLQPLDKGCFPSLSKHYRSACSWFMATSKVDGLFAEAWERSMTLMNIRAGFRVTGICPFSPDCLPERTFATCLQDVPMAISVPTLTELNASDEL